MEEWTDWLSEGGRLVVDAVWRPLQGERFQPTSFPNLGAAEYDLPDGRHVVVVESPQSMVNRLEALSWDDRARRPIDLVAGLPWVEVVDGEGRFLTSSRLEPHRLNGAWLRNSKLEATGQTWKGYLGEKLGLRTQAPLDWSRVYRAVMDLDPFCLIHGVFFADEDLPGQPKVARALTPTLDAYGARPVVLGGVKKESVVFKNQPGQGSQEGYGFIPFPRTEFTAEAIRGRFVLDLEQIRSYGLDEGATRTLFLLALWEIRRFTDEPRRLRTFCDLEVEEVSLGGGRGRLPALRDLEDHIRGVVPASPAEPLRLVHG